MRGERTNSVRSSCATFSFSFYSFFARLNLSTDPKRPLKRLHSPAQSVLLLLLRTTAAAGSIIINGVFFLYAISSGGGSGSTSNDRVGGPDNCSGGTRAQVTGAPLPLCALDTMGFARCRAGQFVPCMQIGLITATLTRPLSPLEFLRSSSKRLAQTANAD